jgi:hypothetical protein
MNRTFAIASLLLSGLLICNTAAAQPTQPKPKRMLGKFEIFSTPARSGYIDTTGKVVIEKDFHPDKFRNFTGGLAAVSQESAKIERRRWGFIDKSAKAVIDQNFWRVNDFSEGLAAVAGPLTDDQADGIRVGISITDWFHFPPYDWNRAPDDGWLGNDSVWQDRTSGWPGQCGFIDKTGTRVIPLRFSRVRSFREGLAYAVKGKISGFINKSGEWVINSEDGKEFTGDFSEGLAIFCKSEKEGCIDKKGNVIIPPKFHCLHDFSHSRAAFATKNGDYGFIDKTGKIVIQARYKNVRPFSEGLAAVWLNSRWGYIDRDGKVVVAFKYEQALGFSGGLAAVCVNGKWGYIDKTGKMVIAPQFAGASVFKENRARVNIGGNYYFHPFSRQDLGSRECYRVINGHWRYIDKSGKFISDTEFDDVLDFRDGLAAFRVFKKYGLKDAKGRVVLPARYVQLDERFCNGMARVRSKGRWGFIDESGKITVRPAFDRVSDFGPGPAAVRVARKWGHVDRNGHVIVQPQYIDAMSFSEQRAAVDVSHIYKREDSRWGYIDLTGKLVSEPIFEEARPFSESLAAVKVNGKYGYIDKSGKMVIKPRFDGAYEFSNGLAVVRRKNLNKQYDGFWGVIDKQGKYVIPSVFHRAPTLKNGMYAFKIHYKGMKRPTYLMVNRKGFVCKGDKVLKTVAEHFLPGLIADLDNKDQNVVRDALRVLSGIPGPKAIQAMRKSFKNPDVRTCLLGAKILAQATGQHPLDILLKQLGDAEPKVADRINDAIMQMISDPPTAAAFLGKSYTVLRKYRKQLLQRAVMELEIGPHVPNSWRSRTVKFTFKNEEFSDIIDIFRYVRDLPIFVDWQGLAKVSVKPTTVINLQLDDVTLKHVWDKILLTKLGSTKVDSIVIGENIVVSTRDRLRAIVVMLSTQPSIGKKKPAKNKAVQKILQTTLPIFSFNGVELSDVLQFCRDISDATIEIDWNDLVPLGVKPKTPVNAYLQNSTFDTALKLVLVSAAGPGKLTYKIDDGKIHIIKAPKASAPPLPDPVTVLTKALYADPQLRLRAVEALGNIGPLAKSAIPALTKMLKDQDKQIQNAAAAALKRIDK